MTITDHRCYNYKNYAEDVPITIIPGMEFDDNFESYEYPGDGPGYRCFHTVCIGPSKEDGNGYEQDEELESGTARTQEEYQVYLDEIHAKGNMTIYCHPQWSGTPTRYFERLRGDFAMEIWNSGCAMSNDMDMDAAYWDDLLGQGRVIYGVATDDGHSMKTHCNGWVMVRAENNVNAILSALKNGEFYSSCGPEIYDFYIENGKAIVECSPAAKIRFHSDKHPTWICRSEDGTMTHAEFDISWQGSYNYLRVSVIDKDGKHAWTNPIFLDDSDR